MPILTQTKSTITVSLGVGDIAFALGAGKLVLQELSETGEVGSRIAADRADELATGNELTLQFKSVESLDVMLGKLLQVKVKMLEALVPAKAPKTKYARVLRTDETVKYKRFSELTDDEKSNSTTMPEIWNGNEIMREPIEGRKCWKFLIDKEVELLN